MARTPKQTENPVSDFMKNAPQIWRTMVYTSLIPMARMSSDVIMTALRDKSADIVGGSKFAEISGSSAVISAVENTITKALNGKDQLQGFMRIKKEGDKYRFNLIHRMSGVLRFSQLLMGIPGFADIKANNPVASDEELFGPTLVGLQEAGYDIKTLNINEPQRIPFQTAVSDTLFMGPSDNPNTKMILSNNFFPKDFKWQTSAYKIEIGATILFQNDPEMYEVTVDPYMDLVLHQDVFNALSESDSADVKNFLGLSWMQQAVHNGMVPRSTKKWSAAPYTDLRITSKQLDDIVRNHGKAKPRVNKDNIAISEQGLPVYLFSTDACADYMRDMGKAVVEEDGFMSFDQQLETWSNKVILTDWFNDALVYTDEAGKLRVYRMHGFIAMNKNSEYVFMQTPLIDVAAKDMLNTAVSIARALVTEDEATNFLPQEYKLPTAYNGGRVTESLERLINTFLSATDNLTRADESFVRDTQTAMSLKHILGQDLIELPGNRRDQCVHAHAWLKALASKRKKIEAPVMSRMIGFEWLLIAAQKATDQYPELRAESIQQRQLFKPAPLLDQVDIPNIDAGGNFLGVLPHQLRILSNRFAGKSDASVSAAAGGGKCVVPSTLVPTDKGIFTVGELRKMSGRSLNEKGFKELKNISVITRDGLKAATATYARKGHTVKVMFSDGSFIEGLPEHRVLSLLPEYDLEHVRLDKLQDIWVPKMIGENVFSSEEPDLTSYFPPTRGKGYTEFLRDGGKLPKTMTPELAKILGFIVSEGWVPKKGDNVRFSNHDTDILDQFDALTLKVFGVVTKTTSNVGSYISHAHARRFVRNLLNDQLGLSKDRKIPICIRSSTKTSQSAFLKAMFEGDGWVYVKSDNRWEVGYATVSSKLAMQMKVMLENFGIFTTMQYKTPPKSVRTLENEGSAYSYTLKLAKTYLSMFESEIGFISDRKTSVLRAAVVHHASLQSTTQGTNDTATGHENYLPLRGLATQIMNAVVHEATKFNTTYRELRRVYGKAKHALGVILRGREKRPNMTNLYTVTHVIDFVNSIPENILKSMSSGWHESLEQLKLLSSYIWVQATDVSQKRSYKTVMDLSVPGPHEYSANGVMSHNTIMILADILKKKMDNPSWKPLILTKGRLVKGFISEINYFCKGKVNVMSLSGRQIRYLKRTLKIDTAEKFLNYIRSLPANTIFICGYSSTRSRATFFNDLKVPNRVFDTDIALPQMVHLLRLIGFEKVCCDESHMIKNMKSLQSQVAYTILAQSEEKIIASGTQTHNTVVDMVGQGFGLNPMIFGRSVEGFKDKYQIASGLVDQDNAQVMKRRINKFVQENVASKEDWSFLLPDLVDTTLTAQMTLVQSNFYRTILERGLARLKAELEGTEIPDEYKDPEFPSKDEPLDGRLDSDDDDGEEEEEDEDEADEDDEDAGMLQKLDRSLQKVEAFLAAPDENEEFLRLLPPPSANDLISPMVALVDRELDRIYADPNGENWNNKTAVFGIHRVASRHFMKHSRWAARCIHYTAGNEEVIRRFKTEAQTWILVADSSGLREGENLQMLSHIFELQCMWSPGDFEQLVSRMYRPDPKGVYNKDKIYHYWCTNKMTNGSPDINTLKLARMASKSISVARYNYSDDPRWTRISRQFDELDMLKMSFDFISNAKQTDVMPYTEAWTNFVDWQTSLNQVNREKFANDLEASNPGIHLLDPNGRVLDRKLFTAMAMKEVVSTKQIPGSKKAYVPWDRGATPADPFDLGLVVLGSQNIAVGDTVMTEFGPGIVQGVGKVKCLIELYGLRKASISRQSLAISLDPKGRAALSGMISNPSVWKSETIGPVDVLGKIDPAASLAPRGSIKPARIPTVPSGLAPVKLEEPIKPKPPVTAIPAEDDLSVIEEIYVELFNGMPALTITDPPPRIRESGWSLVPDYISLTFRDWGTAEKVIEAMAAKFYITKNNYDKLLAEMATLRSGKAMRLNQVVKDTAVRNFFMTEMTGPKEMKGKDVVHPYWVANDRVVKLVFSKKSHSQTVQRWVKKLHTNNPTKVKSAVDVQGFAVKMFSNLSEAADEIRNLGKLFDIPAAQLRNELRELRDEVKDLKAPMRAPTKSARTV